MRGLIKITAVMIAFMALVVFFMGRAIDRAQESNQRVINATLKGE